MIFHIVEGRAYHCGQMSRILRADHVRAVMLAGSNCHRALRYAFDASSYRRAWLVDGELAGLGGVTGSALASSGVIWLALSEQARRYPLEIVKEARRQLALIMQTKREVTTWILRDDPTSMRFADFLGFRPMRNTPDTIGQGTAIQMILRKERRMAYTHQPHLSLQ